MWPEPKRDVAVGCPIQHDFVGSLELSLIVVGGKPADDDLVVASKLLPPEDDVASHRAAQLLIHREVAKKLLGSGVIELGAVDELLPQIRVGTQMQQAQRRL